MRFSTKLHGIIDYLIGGGLLISPFLLGTAPDAAGISSMLVGAVVVGNALLTDYEFGARSLIQMPVHLWIDGIAGLLLGVSPWILAFYRSGWVPHVSVGVLLMVVAFLTHTVPGYDRRQNSSRPA